MITEVAVPETASVLDQLERVIRWSDGFTLAFVKCNHPTQSAAMRQSLRERFGNKRLLEIELEKPVTSLLRVITEHWDAGHPPQAVCLSGLEKAITQEGEASPVFQRLNHDRDLLRKSVPVALLIWLPDFALDCLARGAPDFWAWRSGVYEFPTDSRLWLVESQAVLSREADAVLSLRTEEKLVEVRRLEELLRAARALPQQDNRSRATTANLLRQLGLIYEDLGDLDKAAESYNQAADSFEALGDRRSRAVTLSDIAQLRAAKGEMQAALQLHQEALAMSEASGDQRLRAVTLGNIARVRTSRGEVAEALHLLREKLAIVEALGDQRSRAVTLGDIARLHVDQGDLDMALRLYQEEMAIYDAMGDQRSQAIALGDVAQIRASMGDVDAALHFLEKKLAIVKALGAKRELAVTMGNIARIQAAQGRIDAALQLAQDALGIFEALGDLEGKASTLWSIAQIEQQQQKWQQAFDRLTEAYAINLKLGRLDGICAVGLDLGRLLSAAGQREEGLAILERSRDGFLKLGRRDYAQHAQSLIDHIAKGQDEASPEGKR